MSPLGFKSVVYHGELRLGELNAIPVKEGFRFPNDEIRIHRLSHPGERCPPLAVLQTISPYAIRCKLESFSPVKPTELTHLHATCFHESKTAAVLLGDEEIHLVAMPSKEKKFPCFWCFSVPVGLYHSCLRMLNMRCLSIVFDLDETLIVANTMKSFEDRIEALRAWIAQETDPNRKEGMSGELKRYMDDRMLLKQYIENDYVFDNGVMLKVQHEEVSPLSDCHDRVIRPVIRLQDKNIVLTRINPEVRDTSVLVRLRPAWDDLRCYLTAKGRKRFEVYVCTMAEREYALEIWRLLDPEAELISSKQLLERVVCVKSGSRKSLLNVFHDGICHPKMAMVIDDRSKVWEDQDQPRVHVVPAFSPYHLPQAETANPIPILCIARNVACNVRGYFFKEFDENLIRNISLVSYEDEVGNLPPTPDVSNYLTTEDTGYVMNGKIGAPFRDGMNGGEVEQRLNQADEKAAADSSLLPAASSSEVKPETLKPQSATVPNVLGSTSTSASMSSNKPSLLGVPRRENQFSDAGRPLVMKPGFDSKIPNSGQPALLSRFPVQTPPFSGHPQGGWLVEEQSNRSLLGRPSGVNQTPFSSTGTGSAVAPSISHGFAPQFRSEELRVSEDPKRQNFPLLQPADASLSQNNLNHVSSNGKEHQTESGNHNGLPSHLFVSVLQEIGRRCGSKVEFRSVLSANKDSQFSVEVLYAGEKIAVGLGRTRKDAYQQAAENALHSLADKYLAYIAPLAVVADREQRHENGFLWDTPNSASNEGSIVDESPSESALEKNQDAGSL